MQLFNGVCGTGTSYMLHEICYEIDFSIFNTSELRVHGPICAIFNDLFSVYKLVEVNHDECVRCSGRRVAHANDCL